MWPWSRIRALEEDNSEMRGKQLFLIARFQEKAREAASLSVDVLLLKARLNGLERAQHETQ